MFFKNAFKKLLKIKTFKRGSDDLLCQTGTVSNGALMSPQSNHPANNNNAKKVKLARTRTNLRR